MKSAYWSVLSRAVAAVLGGYALANTLPVARVAVGFGSIARSDAVLIAMQLGFLAYTGSVMWAFAAGIALSAWTGLSLLVLLTSFVAWVAL